MVGLDLVLLATVVDVMEPRWNGPGGERLDEDLRVQVGIPSYIWTPIRVHVDEVLRGELSERSILLRSIGGSRDGVTVEAHLMGQIHDARPGQQLVVFLGKGVDAGDGLFAFTPSAFYTVEGGRATAENRSHQVSMEALRSEIAVWSSRPREGGATDLPPATTSTTTPGG